MVAKKTTKKPAKKTAKVARSSESGKFVSEDFAKKHPSTTQRSKRPKKEAVKVENGKSEVVVTQTDASVSSESSQAVAGVALHASHAEAVQALENENKAFVSQVEPKPSVLEVARQAWSEVKNPNDPEFDLCVPTHRDKFLSHAESVLKGANPMEGDTQLARFEQAVSRLNKEN